MKNFIYCLVLVLCFADCGYAQNIIPYQQQVSQAWVPVVVNTINYVPYNYSVTNYYSAMVPVNVPVIQYYTVPIVPVARPCFMLYRPFYSSTVVPYYQQIYRY